MARQRAAAPIQPSGAGGLERLIEAEERMSGRLREARAEAGAIIARAREAAAHAEEALERELTAESERVAAEVRAALTRTLAALDGERQRRLRMLASVKEARLSELARYVVQRVIGTTGSLPS